MRTEMLAGLTLLLVLQGASAGTVEAVSPSAPFPRATIHLERNTTDGDDEVVIEVDGGANGLTRLTVTAPDGRQVIDFTTAPGTSAMGIRQFRFESPEPAEGGKVRAAYPAGVYTFAGATPAGAQLESKVRLTHTLPGPAKVLRPANEAEVSPGEVEITWAAPKGVAEYVLIVEQEELGESITTRLPGSAQRFMVPAGFLRAGKEYRVGLGTIAGGGNAAFVETTFTTAGGKE